MSDTFDHEGDAWDSLNDGYYDEPGHYFTPRPPPKCRACGTTCYWVQENGRWQLNERGQRHICPPKIDNLEGFD